MIEPAYNGNFYEEGANGEHGVGVDTIVERGRQEVNIEIMENEDSGSGFGMENDTLQLTWGYLDQLGGCYKNYTVGNLLTVVLGLPEHLDAFNTQYGVDYF